LFIIFFFHLVKAFHVKWSGINLDTNIAKWSVTIVELDQNKRHLDRARLLAFWDELDKFMIKNKPQLCI
jgi:parafibromin